MTAVDTTAPAVFVSDPDPIRGQFLMEEWPDGRRTISWRAASWETWSAPVAVKAVAMFGGAS